MEVRAGAARDRHEGLMVRLSASIMAHPSRTWWVRELVVDLGWDLPVAWDEGAGVWETCRRAWQMRDPAATHHLVLQDDALVPYDFRASVESAIEHLPVEKAVVSLYLGTPHPGATGVAKVDAAVRAAGEQGCSWISLPTLRWGLAVVLPVEVIDGMLAWKGGDEFGDADDQRIGRYCRDVLGWRTFYTWPSLVDHRDSDSLLGHGSTHARNWVGAASSGLALDWTKGVVRR